VTSALLLVFLIAPARAARLEAPPKTLPPLLLGPLASAASPIAQGMDSLAKEALALTGAGGGVPAGLAWRHLAAVVERRGLDALPLSVGKLAASLETGDPFRGGYAAAKAGGLLELSQGAMNIPALAALFEGKDHDGSHQLSGHFFDGGVLFGPNDDKSAPLRKGSRSTLYAHPALPGALVELHGAPVEASIFSPIVAGSPQWKEALSRLEIGAKLSDAGAGPRVFGVQALSGATIRPMSHVVTVREAVYGKRVSELIDERAFGEAELGLVQALFEKLAAARLIPKGLGPRKIMIGVTAADPTPRAYLLGADGFEEAGALDAKALTRTLFNAPVDDRLLSVYSNGVYQGLLRRTTSLASLLAEGLHRAKNSGFRRRLADALASALEQIARVRVP
jgi:hypothetical protein